MPDVTSRALRPPSAPVHGTLFLPAAAAPPAAVLVIGGSGGSEPSYVGQALASEGFAALSVAYFARERLPAQLRGIRLEYFMSALEILRSELPSAATPIVVLGMSRGSEAAMRLAAFYSSGRGMSSTSSVLSTTRNRPAVSSRSILALTVSTFRRRMPGWPTTRAS